MNKTKWMLVSLLALFTFLVLPLQASAGWLNRVARKLNLSSAQQAQIKTLAYNSRRKQISIKAGLQLARLDLKQLLDQHKPSEAKVLAELAKVGAMELKLKQTRIIMMLRIKAVLTAKQAARWSQMKNRRRAHRRRMRKNFRRRMRRRRWNRKRRRRRGAGNRP